MELIDYFHKKFLRHLCENSDQERSGVGVGRAKILSRNEKRKGHKYYASRDTLLQLQFGLDVAGVGIVGFGVPHLRRRGVVDEPVHDARQGRSDAGPRELHVGFVQGDGESVLFALSGADESDASGVVDNGEGEGDALVRRFRGFFDEAHPGVVVDIEELRLGEERRGVSIGAHAEQDEIEDGESGGILSNEMADQLILVFLG